MKRKLLSPIDNCFEILSLNKQIKIIQIKEFANELSQFNFPKYSKYQFKKIRSELLETSAIFQEVLLNNSFGFPFEPNLINNLVIFYKNQKDIPSYVSCIMLLSYLSWSTIFYSTGDSSGLATLLNALILVSQAQKQPSETLICDLAISSFFHAYTLFFDRKKESDDLTELISPLNDFFLFNKNLPDPVFNLLSRAAHEIINQSIEPQSNLESNFYDIIDSLIQFNINIPTDILIQILERSYFSLRRLDSSVLSFFDHSAILFDDETILKFLPILPLALLESIEKSEIITKVPNFDTNQIITPKPIFLSINYQHITQSTFDEEPVIEKIEFPPSIPLEDMINKKQKVILNFIINILKQKCSLICKFVEDFGPFLIMATKSKHCYDYFSSFFQICDNLSDIKINFIDEKKFQNSIIINNVIFNPSMTIFSVNSENKDDYVKISTLRSASLNFFLNYLEKNQIKKVFFDIVSNPYLFAEMVHRLLLFQIDFSSISIVNAITSSLLEPMLFYRSWTEGDKKSINIARNSVLSYFSSIFHDQLILSTFFSNTHFVRFILPLLFEDPLRSRILHYLTVFLTNGTNIKNEITNEIIATLMFIISNADNVLNNKDSKKSIELMTSIFEIANIVLQKVPSFTQTFEPLASLFCGQISHVPKDKAYLPLLKIALKFFHFTTNTRMLNFDELLSLEKGINNICGDEPDEEVAEILIDLFLNENEINKPSLVYLYLQSFLHSKKLDDCFIKLINLCSLNLENCFSLHDGEIDLLILKYIDNWRINNEISLPILRHSLQLIEIISSHICSYEIVRKFISLLCPLEGKYFPYYNSQIISSLHLLSLKHSHFPKAFALPLIDDGQINATVQITNSYFSFFFWILPVSNLYKHKNVLKLAENEIALSFNIYGNLLIFSASSNDFKMNYDIDPKLPIGKLSLISCNFTDDGFFSIYLNTDKVASLNIQRFLFKKQINVTINVTNTVHDKRKLFPLFGPFAILNSLDKVNIARLYRFGNSRIQVPNNSNNNNVIAGFVPTISNGSKFSIENLNSVQFHTNLTRVSIPHNFVDILLTYCKIESLIPLFAQVDMTYKDDTKIIGFLSNLVFIFHEILVQNVESQKSFASSSGFLIISHLLRNANDYHFTFKLYLAFYHIFESLQDPDIKTQLFVGILTNFEIWLKTTAFDHIKILHKLSKMVNKHRQIFVDSLDVKFFITVLQCLYWYEPVEKSICRCLNRVRNEKLKVAKCRGYLFKIALKIANEKLTQNDLIAIIGSATNCGDIKQVSDLLDFISNLIKTKNIQFDPIFIRLVSIITICQTQLSFKIFKIFSNFNNFDIIIDELISDYSQYFINKQLLLKLARFRNPSLICFCSHIATKQSISNRTLFKLISIYKKNFKNNSSCIDEYEIWTISLLFIKKKSVKLQKEIIDYLVQSRMNNFTKLFSQVDLIAEIFKELLINSTEENDFILRLLIDKMIDNVNDNNINQLKSIVIHFILFRRIKIMNDCLEKKFNESPFNNHEIESINNLTSFNVNFSNSKDFLSFVNSFNPSQYRTFHFGLHISKDGEWLDLELVQKSLKKLKMANEIINLFNGIIKRSTEEGFHENYDCFKLENFENFQDNFTPEKVQVNQYVTKIKNTIFKLNTYLSMFNNYNERMQFYAQLWSHFWRSMTITKAPWHSSLPSDLLEELHFKRDNVFCYSFCPFKTRRNYSFDLHLHASFSRDSGSIHQAKEKMNNYIQSKNISANQQNSLLNVNDVEIPHSRENSTDNLLHISNSNKVTFECNCTHVTVKEYYKSTFKIFSDYITIVHSNSNVMKMIEKSSIILVLKRAVLHHQTAIEIFTNVRHSYFINFNDFKTQLNAINALKKVLPNKMIQTTSFKQYFSEQSFTNDWKNRKISNFEYLLLLNIYSGRSFNCASQYPLVPWIISDYNSPTIDLNDEKVYRDLSKAIGTINEHRLKELVEKQNRLKCIHEDYYLFSSGPVCPLNLFLWLIRIEPFTSLHIKVQGGKFDHAARIFYSIPDSFRVASSHMNDFRELIPEFYYFPEFLVNDDKFDLGKLNGQPINDVELPKWANNSPFDFVYTLRKGMESEYVSSHLNQWIDLIWGIKQKAEDNRYKYEMYSDVWSNNPTIEKAAYGTIEGDKKSSIEATLDQVGQIPPQLFNEVHPMRNVKSYQKVSSLKKSIEINFSENSGNNINNGHKIDHILAVNVTLCSNSMTNCINSDDNKNFFSQPSSDNNTRQKSAWNENDNINLESDSDISFDSATNKSKKTLKIKFSILNESGKMIIRIVQIVLYLLSDISPQIRFRSKTQNDMSSLLLNEQKKPRVKSVSTSNILSDNEYENSRTVEQSVALIYSKTLQINDFSFVTKNHSSNQPLIHCFISPSSFLQLSQNSCSPSLTLRGIGQLSNPSSNKDASELSISNSEHENKKDEMNANFISENSSVNESDELFFVGREKADVFVITFDTSNNDITNNSANSNNANNNSSNANNNNNEVDEIFLPKNYSLPYDIVCVASDGFWTAICGKDAVIRLFKRSTNNNNTKNISNDDGYDENLGEILKSGKKPVHSILSFCNSIVCCDVWTPFDTMACGTKDASLMICSLSRGSVTYDINMKKVLQEKFNEIDLDNFVLKKILITPSWGFILTCIDAIKKKDGKVVHILSLFNINGNLIRTKEIDFVVSSWTSWSCEKGFDYVLFSDDNGKLFMFEAFYLDVSRPFYRCQTQIISVKYIVEEMIVIAVSKDGRVFFVPYL